MFTPQRDNAIKEEVQKFTAAKFIREVYYPNWLANVVMIKKANGKWRMSQVTKLYGCFLWIQSDKDGRGRPREDILHYQSRLILLQSNALWSEECGGNIPEVGQPYVSSTD